MVVVMFNALPQTSAPPAAAAAANPTLMLRMLREIKGASLEDISPDGRRLLLYRSSAPMQLYTIPLGGGPVKVSPEKVSHSLEVIELDGKQVLAQRALPDYPLLARFADDRTVVCHYSDWSNGHKLTLSLWDLSGRREDVVTQDPQVVWFDKAVPLTANALIAVFRRADLREREEKLVKLTLPDFRLTVLGAVNPTDPEGEVYGNLAVSPDGRYVAYQCARTLFIRELPDMKVVRQVAVPDETAFPHLLYTPDGRRLVAAAIIGDFLDGEDTKYRVLVYDAASGQLVRTIEANAGHGLAISPDGRWLAAGLRRQRRGFLNVTMLQAAVVLHDFETGRVLATAEFPWVREPRHYGFIAHLGRIFFTPDGSKLLTSVQQATRIWRIER